ncbi:MAG: hypothetical protein DI589_17070 [Shinella sp.]|nr:MAG: hypothetical protein DI589_17070 [Shinella sp.]
MATTIPHAGFGMNREKSGPFRRWRRKRGADCLAGVQPEKDQRHGIARFQLAPASRSRRSLRPPDAPLEPEDEAVHLRRT